MWSCTVHGRQSPLVEQFAKEQGGGQATLPKSSMMAAGRFRHSDTVVAIQSDAKSTSAIRNMLNIECQMTCAQPCISHLTSHENACRECFSVCYRMKGLVLAIYIQCVFSEVGTLFVYIIQMNFRFQWVVEAFVGVQSCPDTGGGGSTPQPSKRYRSNNSIIGL